MVYIKTDDLYIVKVLVIDDLVYTSYKYSSIDKEKNERKREKKRMDNA